jgi:NADH-quinone oxidoreductase subunit C|tara:strand:+ start:208 stop:822 length:615 start_codon:yes stop_codon:yes gene_type:complete
MDLKIKEVEQVINSELTSKIKNTSINFDELLVETTQDNLIQVILFLKSHEKLKFRQLIDIAGVDYPAEEKRFKLIYLLLSHEMNKRIKISISFEIGKKIPTLTKVYPSSNWMEREVFDMYGIEFTDHPDLRRILTDYNFEGYPLRKDFPLTGFKEVRYSEKDKKVIYEPVKLEQNYRDFDFESPWEGTKYINELNEKNSNDKKK